MKTVIVLESWHKGNTRKLVEAIARRYGVEQIDVRKTKTADLSGYDLIGFASGVYVERPGRRVTRLLRDCLPEGKPVFFLYTCGSPTDKYMEPLRKAVEQKHGTVLGIYGCPGYYDFKLMKRNQGHPDEREIQGAVKFFEEISKKI